MGSTGPVNGPTASGTSGGRPGRWLAVRTRHPVRAPVVGRVLRELAFCAIEGPLELLALATLVALPALLGVAVSLLAGGAQPRRSAGGHPAHAGGVLPGAGIGLIVVLVVLVTLVPWAARWFGAVHRGLVARLLGERIAAPPPRRGHGPAGWLTATLRDGPGWRAAAYVLVKLPVTAAELYAAFLAGAGLANLTYPFWWPLFRNHPPGVRLGPVDALTPFGALRIATFPGTFAALAAGAAMLLAAPWLARAACAADRWLIRGMLGPGRLAQRVADLEQARALAVDDSAALLRRLERDLHDGAQVRLATLAMHLGMAKEKLGENGAVPDAAAVRELIDVAHQGAKDALTELRGLARGLHPAALDNGLADALATLAAGSAIPVDLQVRVPVRPTAAIETIAYFCAAELLANAAKHSSATRVEIHVTGQADTLRLEVGDDGTGGADPARGSGLAGLAQRVAVVDGRLSVSSPPGGPTRITAELPLRA
jgi:signal transduction histidine kinase